MHRREKRPKHNVAGLWRLWRDLRTYDRLPLSATMLLSTTAVATALCATAAVWLAGAVLNGLFLHAQEELQSDITLLLTFGVVGVVSNAIFIYLTRAVGGSYEGNLRNGVLLHVFKLTGDDPRNIHGMNAEKVLNEDVPMVRRDFIETTLYFLQLGLMALLFISSLAIIDLYLSALAAVGAGVFVFLDFLFRHFRAQRAGRVYIAQRQLHEFESKTVDKLTAVASLGLESRSMDHHERFLRRLRHTLVSKGSLAQLHYSSLLILVIATFTTLTSTAVERTIAGPLSAATVVSFLLYLGLAAIILRGLVRLWRRMLSSYPALENITVFLRIQPKVKQRTNARQLIVQRGEIQFHHLWRKDGTGQQLFKNVDIFIDGGEHIALVGPQQEAKMALINLLLRFDEPDHGMITIDGIDIRDVTIMSLRKNIGVLWQAPYLLHDTIRANLLAAQPGADDADIITACQASHAWEFISRSEGGLETLLGVNGVQLSLDQQQRIAIAQLLLRDPAIICIDERILLPHREEVQEKLAEAIEHLRVGRTAITLAQRYATIKTADSVVYFGESGTSKQGPHEELAENNAAYRSAVQWLARR